MKAGQSWQYRRVLLQTDFDRFARLSGDDNPIHCDPAFARRSHFGATVAHGMMLYACIAKGLTEFVGPGVQQLEQSLMFSHPTFVHDPITISLSVAAVDEQGVLEIVSEVSKPGPDGTPLPTASGRTRVVAAGVAVPAMAPPAIATGAGDRLLYGLRVGNSASDERIFSLADLEEYGNLSGDRNPLFREGAQPAPRVPGPLLAGMFSDLLGTRLPGRGTGWMKQVLRFPRPAYPGENLRASVSITRLRADKELVNLATRVSNGKGDVVCDGEALVLVRNLENKQDNKSEYS